MEFLRQIVERLLGIKKPAPPVILAPETSLLTLPEFIPDGFKYGVEILNDNVTTMDFVVPALGTHLGLTYKESIKTMLSIHHRGGVLVPTSSMLEADKIARALTAEAARHGYPLVCRAVTNT